VEHLAGESRGERAEALAPLAGAEASDVECNRQSSGAPLADSRAVLERTGEPSTLLLYVSSARVVTPK